MKSDKKSFDPVLLLIVLLGVLLRVRDLDLTLPYFVSDGGMEVKVALRMLQEGDPNPHYFKYGGFPLYLLAGAEYLYLKIYHWFNSFGGSFAGFLSSLSVESNDFILFYLGRYISLAFGLGNIYLGFRCADILWGRKAARLAAFFSAICPVMVFYSQVVNVDVISIFFMLLTFYFSLRIWQTGGPGGYLWAGAAAGLAIATKYNFVAAVPIIAAHFLRNDNISRASWLSLGKILLSLYMMAMAFFLASPYTLLDFKEFFRFFATFSEFQNQGTQVLAKTFQQIFLPNFLGQFFIMLPLISGFLYLGAVLGIGWFWNEKKLLILLGSVPLIYIPVSGFFMKIISPPHSLPVLPFFIILSSGFLAQAAGDLRAWVRRLAYALIGLQVVFSASDLLVPHYAYPFIVHRDFGRWVEKNIRPGKEILMTRRFFPETRSFWEGRARVLNSPADFNEEMITRDRPEYIEVLFSNYGVAKEEIVRGRFRPEYFDVKKYLDLARRLEAGEFGYRKAASFGLPPAWGKILAVAYPWHGPEMTYAVFQRLPDETGRAAPDRPQMRGDQR